MWIQGQLWAVLAALSRPETRNEDGAASDASEFWEVPYVQVRVAVELW